MTLCAKVRAWLYYYNAKPKKKRNPFCSYAVVVFMFFFILNFGKKTKLKLTLLNCIALIDRRKLTSNLIKTMHD